MSKHQAHKIHHMQKQSARKSPETVEKSGEESELAGFDPKIMGAMNPVQLRRLHGVIGNQQMIRLSQQQKHPPGDSASLPPISGITSGGQAINRKARPPSPMIQRGIFKTIKGLPKSISKMPGSVMKALKKWMNSDMKSDKKFWTAKSKLLNTIKDAMQPKDGTRDSH